MAGCTRRSRAATGAGVAARCAGASMDGAGLAREATVSRSVLDARFRELLGRPPIRYLTEWRMHLAEDLLATTDLGVAAVAHRVGYDAEEAFSRAFKRVHGESPSVWRSARPCGEAIGRKEPIWSMTAWLVHPNGLSTRSDPHDLVPLGSRSVMTSGVGRKARRLQRAWVILAATAALLSSGLSVIAAQPARAATAFTGAFFDSEAGEYIGQGQTHSFTTVTSNFATNTHAYFNVATGGDQFFVWFTPPMVRNWCRARTRTFNAPRPQQQVSIFRATAGDAIRSPRVSPSMRRRSTRQAMC